ncbi:hypothetical protein AVEN_70596-1 [Araneus ventricosus]|uniref:Uncharacterized protein n=1 Tax=Araneus ventricosus TaxID=182803 RepID=A0A4Y2CHF5_ARAVE|nr:hypothetical protein AVEN_70596-1 [Araneus ventricosus]
MVGGSTKNLHLPRNTDAGELLTKCIAKEEEHEGYFETDLIILNRCQMTRATPDLEPLSKLPHHTSGRTCFIHGGSSVESGFESGTLWPRSRSLTLRPPRLHDNFDF